MVANALSIPDSPISFGNGKLIASRLIEVTSGSGTAYVVNRFVMKNDADKAGTIRILGVIVASDVIGEYICDYANGRKLAYFAEILYYNSDKNTISNIQLLHLKPIMGNKASHPRVVSPD